MIYEIILPQNYYVHSIMDVIFKKSNIKDQQLISQFSFLYNNK